jgi:adenine-specific DNA-methyltransferase
MDKAKLLDILSTAYDQKSWQDVLVNIFSAKNLYQSPAGIPLPANDKADSAYELGKFYTTDDRLIGIYQVNVKPEVRLEKNKVGLRQLLRNIYKYEVDGALITFVQKDKWRLSFVSEIRKYDDHGEVIRLETEPKRYTYLLGVGEKTRTARDRLIFLEGKKINLEDIREAFSVEKLNEEFYQTIAQYFYKLVGATAGKGKAQTVHDRIMTLPSVSEDNNRIYHEFAVRLIGRIIFCWFLKMKRSESGASLLPESLLSSDSVGKNYGYYKNILERLFFQTLNTPMKERSDNLPPGCENIPFLNGGLFEPHTDDFFRPDGISGISTAYALEIPDKWFLELFSELEKFNFTIDENSINDMEVSVDPEMLGRIFENLLAEIDPDSGETARKATGSFYTPREIVDYMATESLVHYLHKETEIKKENIELLFKSDSELKDETITDNKSKILDALDKVKILDPACGSGAFPMGVLQKIVTALQKLDPDCKLWIKRQLDRIDNPIFKKQAGEKLKNASVEYARKLGVIQNSLYGVDIQPIAAEISKLRCFLTLVVDEKIDETKENRGVEALPNLEFKFVTTDTLIKLPEEINHGGLFNLNDELEKLKDLRKDYLQSYGKEKAKLKKEFQDLQKEMLTQQFTMGEAIDYSSKAYKISSWKPFSHEKSDWFDPLWMFGIDGFDIVIGNPPYVQLQKDGGRLADMYKNCGYKTFQRTGDIYALFYESGINSLNEKGNLCFITSNKWMRAGYGKSLRNFFISKNPIMLIDLGPGIFKQATVDTNILLIEKSGNDKQLKAVTLKKTNGGAPDVAGYYKDNAVDLNNLSEESWFIGNDAEQKLKEKIEKIGKPLKDWDVNIYYGIKTGLNEAFIIDTATKEKLCKEDPKSTEIIKPILRGRDIKRYSYEWAGLWILATGYDINVPKKYPAVYKYMLQYEEQAKKRDDQGANWWNLRACAYYNEFEKEKVIYPETTQGANFFLDIEGKYYIEKTGFFLSSKEISLRYLTGLFCSSFFTYIYKKYYSGVELGTVGYQYNKHALEKTPLPIPTRTNKNILSEIESLVGKILSKKEKKQSTLAEENQIDKLVYKLYELTDEEIRIVEGE